jgi:hypothetical protein
VHEPPFSLKGCIAGHKTKFKSAQLLPEQFLARSQFAEIFNQSAAEGYPQWEIVKSANQARSLAGGLRPS